MTPSKNVVAGSLIVLALVASGFATRASLSLASSAAADARLARAQTTQAIADADRASAFVASQKLLASQLQSQRDSALKRAAQAEALASVARTHYEIVSYTAPDTCADVVAAADSALAAQDTVIEEQRQALKFADEANARLRVALDTTELSLARLRAASVTLVKADVRLEQSSKPSLLARLLPHPGVGVAAGFDPAGRSRVITGITLGWVF